MSANMKQLRLISVCIGALLFSVLVGFSGHAGDALDVTKPRTLTATRITQMPVIDGKLDDACWKQVASITDFTVWNSEIPAEYQSEAKICYDDSTLYISVKCLLPRGVKPGLEKGSPEKKKRDDYIFSDDHVEIHVDPGRSYTDYYQIAITPFGSAFDGLRRYGGAQLDAGWDGDWTAATQIADGHWSLEIAIPLHNLGITSNTNAAWGINLCRYTWNPKGEQSSIAARGAFHTPEAFPIVEGLDVDFSNVKLQIKTGQLKLRMSADGPQASFSVPVVNTGETSRRVKLEHWNAGSESAESEIVTLGPSEATIVAKEMVELERLVPARSDLYLVTSIPAIRKVAVSDADSGNTLAVSNIPRPWFLEAARIVVEDPWHKEMSGEETTSISLAVQSGIASEHRQTGNLVVQLLAADGDQVLAEESFSNYSASTKVKLSVGDIAWGAYRVRARFQDADGQDLVSTTAPATILPGGKHQIKVLNNLVSELMNTRQRGLQGQKKIAFMNPREGWVFFSVVGSGHVNLLDPSTPLVFAEQNGPAFEAVRYLPAGRHELTVTGDVDQLIVRAIPQLIYSSYPGEFDWEFLSEHVFPHCNCILGTTGDERAIREWTDQGKRWIGFSAAPGHGVGQDVSLSAEKYWEDRLSKSEGFSHPLLSGVLVDQISSCRAQQKIEIAKMLSTILQNPDLKGRQYSPWFEGSVFGSGPDMAFMRLVLDAGWMFAYYGYIPEKVSEAEVREVMYNTFTKNAISCEEEVPGSVKRCLPQPGFMTYIPHGHNLNVDPGRSYKVLMQMHSETFANDPAFFGTFGQLWYYSPYVSEENLRWSAALFRHYGIEGKTAPLTTDPYVLGHIENPDFADGVEGWNLSEAEKGTMRIDSHPGYGGLQGRFISGSKGDIFLVMRRSAKGPNTVTQTIKGLEPGRMYSMKMITADLGDIRNEISKDVTSAVSISVNGVELSANPEHNIDVSYPSHYGSTLGKFNRDHTAFMTFHRRIFRATEPTAQLTISDWASSDDPGGPVGQELMVNFVEIEPYFTD